MKKKELPKRKLVRKEESEFSKPVKKRYPQEKKQPHRFKAWQIQKLEEEE